MDILAQVDQIKADFAQCRKLLVAIGDETRQAVFATLMAADCQGMRVGEIASGTHLSRPAVSHHLRILLDAGLVGVDPQGTKNYYFVNLGKEFTKLVALFEHIDCLRKAAGGNCYE